MISSSAGADDARVLAREFHSVFDVDDFVNLSRYHIYIKMMIDGTTSKPFITVTLAPPESRVSYKKEIVEFSKIRIWYTQARNGI